jgi:hypothetical protein
MPGGVCFECESGKLIILAFLHLNSRGKFRGLVKALSYNFYLGVTHGRKSVAHLECATGHGGLQHFLYHS